MCTYRVNYSKLLPQNGCQAVCIVVNVFIDSFQPPVHDTPWIPQPARSSEEVRIWLSCSLYRAENSL